MNTSVIYLANTAIHIPEKPRNIAAVAAAAPDVLLSMHVHHTSVAARRRQGKRRVRRHRRLHYTPASPSSSSSSVGKFLVRCEPRDANSTYRLHLRATLTRPRYSGMCVMMCLWSWLLHDFTFDWIEIDGELSICCRHKKRSRMWCLFLCVRWASMSNCFPSEWATCFLFVWEFPWIKELCCL